MFPSLRARSPTDWMKNLRARTGKRFTGQGRRISTIEIFNRGKLALYRKYYGLAPTDIIDDWFSESSVIEISAIERACVKR